MTYIPFVTFESFLIDLIGCNSEIDYIKRASDVHPYFGVISYKEKGSSYLGRCLAHIGPNIYTITPRLALLTFKTEEGTQHYESITFTDSFVKNGIVNISFYLSLPSKCYVVDRVPHKLYLNGETDKRPSSQ